VRETLSIPIGPNEKYELDFWLLYERDWCHSKHLCKHHYCVSSESDLARPFLTWPNQNIRFGSWTQRARGENERRRRRQQAAQAEDGKAKWPHTEEVLHLDCGGKSVQRSKRTADDRNLWHLSSVQWAEKSQLAAAVALSCFLVCVTPMHRRLLPPPIASATLPFSRPLPLGADLTHSRSPTTTAASYTTTQPTHNKLTTAGPIPLL
jgi:hypothetical protein